MATIETRLSKDGKRTSYRVKWRTGGTGPWDSETFDASTEAKRWKSVVEAYGHQRPGAEDLIRHGFADLVTGPLIMPVAVVPDPEPEPMITLETYTCDYIAALVKPNRETRRKYRERLDRHVFPDLGERALISITRRMMREWQNGLVSLGLSPKTIANIRGEVLYPMFDAACLPGEDDEPALRTYNPIKGLPLPDREEVAREYIETIAEAELFIACAYEVDAAAAALIVMALASGMRWGELAGLPVRAVHPDHGTVSIRQVLVREHHSWLVRARPKSKDGYREIPIPQQVMDLLVQLCAGRKPTDFVFTAPEGGPWRYSQFYDGRWEKVRDLALQRGLGKRMTIHGLRHSTLSHLATEGIDVAALKVVAGHKKFATTFDIYVHANRKHHPKVRELVGPFAAVPAQHRAS